MHGNSRAKKVVSGHGVKKVSNNRFCKEKELIKCKERGHIEYKAREAWGTWNAGARRASGK